MWPRIHNLAITIQESFPPRIAAVLTAPSALWLTQLPLTWLPLASTRRGGWWQPCLRWGSLSTEPGGFTTACLSLFPPQHAEAGAHEAIKPVQSPQENFGLLGATPAQAFAGSISLAGQGTTRGHHDPHPQHSALLSPSPGSLTNCNNLL